VNLTSEQVQQIRRLIKAGNKIEAIKQFRNITDVGLAEAMAAVNALEAGTPITAAVRGGAPKDLKQAEQAALAAIREGNMIEAIKRYRLHSKIGLKEAKDAVDALSVVHRTDGRIDAKLARSLIAMVASGQTQEAITQLMSNKGYEEAEARTIIKSLGRLKAGGASCGAGCLKMLLVLIGLVVLAVVAMQQLGLL
jgi:ribosomal protein L7/L12